MQENDNMGRFRWQPAPLSMEAYETYHVDDVYIICDIGSNPPTKALLTLSEFHTVCVGENPAEECTCEGK